MKKAGILLMMGYHPVLKEYYRVIGEEFYRTLGI